MYFLATKKWKTRINCAVSRKGLWPALPSGNRLELYWIRGSMTITTWTEEAEAMSNDIISLKTNKNNTWGDSSQLKDDQKFARCLERQLPHPSARGHSKLGPRTMAMLLGVILFTACCSDNRDRNWTRYLTERQQKQKHTWFTVKGKNGTAKEYLKWKIWLVVGAMTYLGLK